MKLIKKFQDGKKFSNTPTGRAMQRLYDSEHGIIMQKVLPEVEVFPNYYNIDDNGYSNSFAIPLEHRPTTFSLGEISQPYVPKKLDELGWLSRTFGINNFGLGIMELIGNPANVVPTGKTIQGIKALTSVGSKAKNAGQIISKAKRVYKTPKANIIPVKNTITTSDIPTITAENATSITPELWTVTQDAAIARGDMTEAQRLRDLHFRVQAPNSKIVNKNGNPIHSYHGTGKHFNEFNTTGKYSTLDKGYYGVGAYFSPNKELAQIYADTEKTPIVYDTYLNIKNPLKHVIDENASLYGKTIIDNDGVISVLPDELIDKTFDMTEYVATKPNQIKLADAVTFDNNGVRIGLGNRDNFHSSDIRYGLLPFILGGGYKYINQDNNSAEYVNGGKLIRREL